MMVWRCFFYHGIGPIYRIEDTMTAATYCNILYDIYRPEAHIKVSKKWFSDNNISTLTWPA